MKCFKNKRIYQNINSLFSVCDRSSGHFSAIYLVFSMNIENNIYIRWTYFNMERYIRILIWSYIMFRVVKHVDSGFRMIELKWWFPPQQVVSTVSTSTFIFINCAQTHRSVVTNKCVNVYKEIQRKRAWYIEDRLYVLAIIMKFIIKNTLQKKKQKTLHIEDKLTFSVFWKHIVKI